MKFMLLGLLMIAPVRMSVSASELAKPNYVFVEVEGKAIPLASVHRGRFDMFSVSDTTPGIEGGGLDDSVGMRGMEVYGYRNGRYVGPGSVTEVLPSTGEGEPDALVVTGTGKNIAEARTFTTRPLKSSARTKPRHAGTSETNYAQGLVRNILKKRQVPQHTWSRILNSTRIDPVRVSAGLEILIIRASAIELGERSLDFFLIAERQGARYHLAMSRIHWNGVSCKQDFDLFDHADLDSDGTDELIYSVYGWEWWRYWIIRRENGRWETVNGIDQQEC